MFEGHPKGLYALALANTGERFGYYTMLAVFALFLRENFGLEAGTAGAIYSTFLGLVYFMPLFGGIMADKFGFGKMVTIGITIMFAGYLLLSLPLGGNMVAMAAMVGALLLISVGTGLFKGNLQVMVGNLYDDPKYAAKRDSGFSLFYMAINIGALFAPTAAVEIKEWAEESLNYSPNDAYHFSFAVACASLIVSILIYYLFRPSFRHVEGGVRKTNAAAGNTEELSPKETKARIVALCLVFAVVIFFWMAFHQNGLTLTYFAAEFTARSASGVDGLLFNVWNLVAIIVGVYAAFSVFQSKSGKAKLVSFAVLALITAYLVYAARTISGSVEVDAPIFQQFNPFYVVALTPVSIAIFGSLAKRGKEPSAPRKIAYGMLVAAVGFCVMLVGSRGLNTPKEQTHALAAKSGLEYAEKMNACTDAEKLKELVEEKDEECDKLSTADKATFTTVFDGYRNVEVKSDSTTTYEAPAAEKLEAAKQVLAESKDIRFVSPYWLILTYLILTFAELLLSPMGISFVSKVAPPKLKGLMMGGWFVATAIGNMLVAVGGFLWAGIPLVYVWSVFVVLCLLSALFMFVMMKRLESVTK